MRKRQLRAELEDLRSELEELRSRNLWQAQMIEHLTRENSALKKQGSLAQSSEDS